MVDDKKILSVDSDDEEIEYELLSKVLEENTIREKNNMAMTINELGDELLREIEIKKEKQNQKKEKYIKYILKHSDDYNYKNLMLYELSDVIDIYTQLKKQNQSFIVKFFHFLINQ